MARDPSNDLSIRARIVLLACAASLPLASAFALRLGDGPDPARDPARRAVAPLCDRTVSRLGRALRNSRARLAMLAERPLVRALDGLETEEGGSAADVQLEALVGLLSDELEAQGVV